MTGMPKTKPAKIDPSGRSGLSYQISFVYYRRRATAAVRRYKSANPNNIPFVPRKDGKQTVCSWDSSCPENHGQIAPTTNP